MRIKRNKQNSNRFYNQKQTEPLKQALSVLMGISRLNIGLFLLQYAIAPVCQLPTHLLQLAAQKN
jgi:hypothetical protein